MTEHLYTEAIRSQFGASIDMLGNAINMCPPANWDNRNRFWYHAFHCIFFLDYYLTPDPAEFRPPPPFTESEFEDRMPPRTYTKEELLTYLDLCRSKCRQFLDLKGDLTARRWVNMSGTMDYSFPEILLYNMRHVQHHAAQLNLLLRQETDDAPDWVFRAY
jgi:hypothetical protein